MEQFKLTAKDSSIAFISSFLLIILGSLLFSILGLIICSFFNISNETFLNFVETNAWGILISTIISNGTIIIAFFLFNRKKENKIFTKPKANKFLIYIALALAAYIMLVPIVNSCSVLLEKIGYSPKTISYNLTPGNYFISLISLVILPSICEELLFRGLLFKGLKPYGKAFSIILSALMFSIFHMSVEQIIYPFMMGLLLGVIMYNENNIIYCITIHFISNFTTLTLSYFGINLFFNHWTFYLIAILLFFACIALFVFLIINSKTIENKQTLTSTNKSYLIGSVGLMTLIWIIVILSSVIKI